MISTSSNAIDICKLPEVVREKLAQLDLELTEGDITEKGYEKKRQHLIEPFLKKSSKQEIRQEAVQQALSKINLNNKCLEQQNNTKEENVQNNNTLLVLPTQQNNCTNNNSFISFRQRFGSRNSRKIQGAQTSG
uniref:DMAP-interaction domain-containing protein n=1 Tax=Meloidogyne hapla TaxID=6305 RepID=A0A1I8B4C2_MELHA